VKHVRRVYGPYARHIIKFFAHRVQRPEEKINHGVVMGGPPGVGKDTIIEPVKRAVGPWNVREVSPTAMLEPFNEYVKAVILRVSEARDLGESNRFALYEHMKNLLATPPDVIRCNEKHLRAHSVFNVMGGIITANRKDSFYLPADDRRHYVAWTDITKEDFPAGYWDEIWGWYEAWRLRPRRCLFVAARPLRLQPQGAAAEDASVLGDRRDQPLAGELRDGRRARQARQMRR
jgi:hypothetical protein